jgi:hypothetical protein
VAWFSIPRASAPMRRGPPALGAPTAGTFGLFLLPRGRPRRFFPALEDPGGEGERWIHGTEEILFGAGVVLRGKWSAEEIKEVPFKEGSQRRNVKSQRGNRSVSAALL